MKPQSRMGTVRDRSNWLKPSLVGAGRPYPLRSGMVSLRSSPDNGFLITAGSGSEAMPSSWLALRGCRAG